MPPAATDVGLSWSVKTAAGNYMVPMFFAKSKEVSQQEPWSNAAPFTRAGSPALTTAFAIIPVFSKV